MLQQNTISPGAARKPSMDFLHLREEALDVVRQLAGEVWTDHNLHDPGITILEQLCYALTDLGYRLNFSVPDLLADALDAEQQRIGWKEGMDPAEPNTLPGMPGLEAVLPAAPTTHTDWQGLLLDIDNVRSAAMSEAQSTSPKVYFHGPSNELSVRDNPDGSLVPINITGLHEIQVDAEEGFFRPVSQAIHSAFHAQRPAGEDLHRLVQLVPAPISLIGEIDLERGALPEEVMIEIFLRVDQYLSPQVRYKARNELLAQGWRMDQVMEGPMLKGGILRQSDLHDIAPKKILYLSRIIEQVFAVPGVQEVRSLRLKGEHAQVSLDAGVNYWVPMLSEGMVPTFDPETAFLTLRIDGMVATVDPNKVRALYSERRQQRKGRHVTTPESVLPRDRKVAAYQSVQHQFPDNYGINTRGLPFGATVPRQLQAHQLKTWLLFFEQILTNYFSKAGNLGHMFQMTFANDGMFPQGSLDDVPAVQASFLGIDAQAQQLGDDTAIGALRRFERLLAHLLSRFSEEIKYFPQQQASIDTEYTRLQQRVGKMLSFYRELPTVTKRRGQGTDIMAPVDTTGETSGLKVRIGALLGLRTNDPDLETYPDIAEAETKVDFVIVEHVLLRPLPLEYEKENMLFRFRNGKIHKIVRLRSRAKPYRYRFKCFASGTEALTQKEKPDGKIDDRVEIVFSVGQRKIDFDVISADNDSFTIDVDEVFATEKGNPQGGSWNKLLEDENRLYVDPWSLQLTYVFSRHDPRFVDAHQRLLVEQALRQETPAHLAMKVVWLDTMDMQAFCTHYYHWRRLHAAYLVHQSQSTHPDERYVMLRYYRNLVLRHIIAGETDPVRDLSITLVPTQGVTTHIAVDGALVVEMTPANKTDLVFELPIVEPGFTYTLVDPAVAVEAPIPYAVIATTPTPTGEGMRIAVAKESFGAGESRYALFATDPSIASGNLLHQQIVIRVM